MQIKINRLYVDRKLRTIHAAQLRDDCLNDDDYYCKILPVQIGRKKHSLSDTYSLTLKGTYFTSGTKDEKDAIVELSETIQDKRNSIYILSDLFEQCWITDKTNIRIKLGQEWHDATYEQNSLIHIDSTSIIHNRSIFAKFSFNCDQRLSSKHHNLFDIINAKSN